MMRARSTLDWSQSNNISLGIIFTVNLNAVTVYSVASWLYIRSRNFTNSAS